ncbi:MATH domain-containing protein [Caenorhabditis elegans]|uniref:MATH domain-containing protein n=1 Tax=Caenorhabditis elegans TaxID=6239 RepID=O16562_CAEEL|nr:MATH domain-containing protein [Caenorhabditis elegans]CCD64676.1 MATH domain-containing protein [Caenorhabditis elegans]|eukprot:NP_494112.1 MATH (meprin-associated Traf homology) domain containing [Caenorhabditis elegans]
MEIIKLNEFLGIFLECEKETCDGGKWTIECEYELKLISASGKLHSIQNKAVFGIGIASNYGKRAFISWNDMEKDYVTNDSIDVEIRVKIINITELPCTEKTFVLSHTVKNMSSIKEGEEYFSDIQTRFNIPWYLQVKRRDGFNGLFLHCSKHLDEFRNWSIKTEYQFKLVSTNGRNVAFYGEKVFEKPVGSGWGKLMRWENWSSRCNDNFVFEANVRILDTTGIEDKNDVDRFSGFAIPVGDQEYSLEKWLEMAFDH